MPINVKQTRLRNPVRMNLRGRKVEARVALPQDGALAGGLLDHDEGLLTFALGNFDEMSFDIFSRELVAVDAASEVVSDLSDVARAKSPAMAGDDGAGDLA